MASIKTSVSQTESLLKKKNEEIQISESALKKQSIEVDALKAKVAELEKVN